jgi:hypothetical protein
MTTNKNEIKVNLELAPESKEKLEALILEGDFKLIDINNFLTTRTDD